MTHHPEQRSAVDLPPFADPASRRPRLPRVVAGLVLAAALLLGGCAPGVSGNDALIYGLMGAGAVFEALAAPPTYRPPAAAAPAPRSTTPVFTLPPVPALPSVPSTTSGAWSPSTPVAAPARPTNTAVGGRVQLQRELIHYDCPRQVLVWTTRYVRVDDTNIGIVTGSSSRGTRDDAYACDARLTLEFLNQSAYCVMLDYNFHQGERPLFIGSPLYVAPYERKRFDRDGGGNIIQKTLSKNVPRFTPLTFSVSVYVLSPDAPGCRRG